MAEADLSRLRIDRGAAGAPPPRRRRRWWLVAALLLVLLAGVAAWRYTSGVEVETVVVGTAYPYQAVTELNAAGYVVAQRKASVASKATGRLEWLGVTEGSMVKEGEVIARLESRDVRAQADQAQAGVGVARANVAQAEAELEDAQHAYQRAKELRARHFVSESAFDAAEARYRKAGAALESARAQIASAEAAARAAEVAVEQTLIRAPFDGVVLTKSANVGDVVTPFSSALEAKSAVVTMADMDTLEVEADVSESSLGKVRVGQACEIQLDALPELRFRGEVSRLVPTVDRAKATVLTKVKFIDRDPRVLPEMSAKVAFLSREVAADQRRPLSVVSPEAIATRDGRSYLYVVEEGKASAVAVQTGQKLGDAIVVSGVSAGDRVVLRPPDKLHDGMAVKLLQKAP